MPTILESTTMIGPNKKDYEIVVSGDKVDFLSPSFFKYSENQRECKWAKTRTERTIGKGPYKILTIEEEEDNSVNITIANQEHKAQRISKSYLTKIVQ